MVHCSQHHPGSVVRTKHLISNIQVYIELEMVVCSVALRRSYNGKVQVGKVDVFELSDIIYI